jgi:hypothetical protein
MGFGLNPMSGVGRSFFTRNRYDDLSCALGYVLDYM